MSTPSTKNEGFLILDEFVCQAILDPSIQDGESSDLSRLIERVRMAGSRSSLEAYLDLVKLLLDDLELDGTDQRLSMSIPKSGHGWGFLPVSLNNRYVVALHGGSGEELIGVIFGPDFERRQDLTAKVAFGRFKALPGEDPKDVPFIVEARSAADVLRDEEFRVGWLHAARHELERGRSSPYRRFHVPEFYQLAMDSVYRKGVLDKAFSSTSGS